ncbi:family 78 glycoside hydrolase catalytic domain [Pelagicoccus sp. SDUM812005]|uniref:family 78 glycoside hydrolase catalytic domain n=1 Tax=Pelagicoccus sp. SDUM812005 TaxID=3041257 RepID=UPI00280C4F75|nr:family 78 glycoside hydrolase catalytic domain [Pelagicoccus sp. SDUM812005]MDQ8179408.1 family 78 glycoside hydrolase catalytic domain [Pelagicoccus sp. SDUM812005]
MKCEYGIEPMGVDTQRPRLSWALEGQGRGLQQSAYQVLVASCLEMLEPGKADLWDSGRVAERGSSQIEYRGKPLSSGQTVFWKVRAWDQAEEVSGWSDASRWTTGLLSGDEWQAQWIGHPERVPNTLLRREFELKPGLERAFAFVTGLGQYELFVNGRKSGDDVLSPGWTDYEETILYDTRDVTELLQEGENAIGISLGNGMYHVERVPGRFSKFVGSFGKQKAVLQLRFEYSDGSVDWLLSDPSWQAKAGPITFSNIYSGEDYDARLFEPGWSQPRFSGEGWLAAVPMEGGYNQLKGFTGSSETIEVIETRDPLETRTLSGEGAVLYDFGQNASYFPRLRISGPAGSKVRLIPGEVLYPDGRITRASMGGMHRGSAWWEYTKATDEVEEWRPQFYYQGYRYLQTQAFPAVGAEALPVIEELKSEVVHSIAAVTGEFETSDPLLNRIRDLVRWAQRSNMVSVLTDCPHREKLGWLEQYHLNGPAIRYEFDMARMYTKGMADMADAQTEEGLVPNIAPEYVKFKNTFRAAAEWGAAYILVAWQQYQFLGDKRLIETHWDKMERYFAYLQSKVDEDGILSEGLGDWYDIGPANVSRSELTLPPRTATAFYFYDAKALSQMAEVLGDRKSARDYARKAEKIREDYNAAFFDETRQCYDPESQCANALPWVLGIAPEGSREGIRKALLEDLEKRDYAMTAGDVGFRYLLLALSELGEQEAVYRIISRDSAPGYAYVLDQGATALTESWFASPTSSNNHFMLGQVTEWYYRYLLGIDNAEGSVGFDRIRIAPNPVGDLEWCKGSYQSRHGKIAVAWTRADDAFRLEVEVPVNATAEVVLPTRELSSVSADVELRLLRMEGDFPVYSIGSGRYVFSCAY